jgi:hypothetical protein
MSLHENAAHASHLEPRAVGIPDHERRSLQLSLADLDHAHKAKLERLRASRMPMIWQDEIADTLRREHEAKRAVYVQRLWELC